MTEDEKKTKIASFRFGLISEFVTGVRLGYGEKERLLQQKIDCRYEIPFSDRNQISRATIEKWICDYKKAGYRLEGLYPQERSDKGSLRSLSTEVKLAIKELKKEDSSLKAPALVKCLIHKKLISQDERINMSTLYRYLQSQELKTLNEDAVDKRHFEAENPNEIWQSDVMHGPYVKVDGRSRKSYLHAILDDHSRFIIHAEFYLNEARESFLDCLRQGILKRGLPQKLYIDNGSCFKTLHLAQIAAQLGIGIQHSRPYTPQGRGKIERWFRYVRENFTAVDKQTHNCEKLDLLNHNFSEWVDEYNNKVHGTTKQSPYNRYRSKLECIRPAPAHLLNYFRQAEFRHVKKDRTVRLMGQIFEAPVCLIDRRVELRFHAEDLTQVELFFQGKSHGFITIVSPHVNAKIGRNWNGRWDGAKKSDSTTKQDLVPESVPTTGQLFSNENKEEVL
jgi:putative transposase